MPLCVMIKEIIYVSVIIIYARWWDLHGRKGSSSWLHPANDGWLAGRMPSRMWKRGARVAVGVTRGCKSTGTGKGDDEKEPGLISLAEKKFWFIIIPPDGQQTLGGFATGVGRTQSLARFIIIIIINFFFVCVYVVWVVISHQLKHLAIITIRAYVCV